jgi:hypothetical protein
MKEIHERKHNRIHRSTTLKIEAYAFSGRVQRQFSSTPQGDLTMSAPTTLDYRFPKYVKTGSSMLLSSAQTDKIINYLRNSR